MVQSLYKKPTPGLKNHMRNLGNYRQAVKSSKIWNLMGYFCPKNTFLQLKHIQRIYQTLLSTRCLKTHQMTYVIFETICHFSRHSPLYIEMKIFRLVFACIKIHKIPHAIFGTKCPFSSNFASLLSVMIHNSSEFYLDKKIPSMYNFSDFWVF